MESTRLSFLISDDVDSGEFLTFATLSSLALAVHAEPLAPLRVLNHIISAEMPTLVHVGRFSCRRQKCSRRTLRTIEVTFR